VHKFVVGIRGLVIWVATTLLAVGLTFCDCLVPGGYIRLCLLDGIDLVGFLCRQDLFDEVRREVRQSVGPKIPLFGNLDRF
jgi:hypothetical protein